MDETDDQEPYTGMNLQRSKNESVYILPNVIISNSSADDAENLSRSLDPIIEDSGRSNNYHKPNQDNVMSFMNRDLELKMGDQFQKKFDIMIKKNQ